MKARPADLPNPPASLTLNESLAASQPPNSSSLSPRATLSTPLCARFEHHHLGLLERTVAMRLQSSAHSAAYSERCSATSNASAGNDTALSARLPSPRRTAQGGTPTSGTTLPWLISPTCPRFLFIFDGLSRQSPDDGQTVNIGERRSNAALHRDDMCSRRSPLCDDRDYQFYRVTRLFWLAFKLGQKRAFVLFQHCRLHHDWVGFIRT